MCGRGVGFPGSEILCKTTIPNRLRHGAAEAHQLGDVVQAQQDLAQVVHHIACHDRAQRPRAAQGDEPYPTRPLSELVDVVAGVDAVVVALPLTDDTRGLISADVLRSMQPHAFFVNVGRGELVDQAALIAALTAGDIGGAGLDVTDPEPLPSDNPLWGLPNVILTPHNSGSTDGTGRRANERFVANLTAWVADESLVSEI